MKRQRKRLGDILIEAGTITEEQLQQGLQGQKETGKKLGEMLIELGLITEEEILDTLSMQLFIERVDLERVDINAEVARSIPKSVASKYGLIPIYEQNGKIFVAVSDPLNVYAVDDIQFITQKTVIPRLASRRQIDKAIELYFNKQSSDQAIEDLKKEYTIDVKENAEEEVLDDIQNAPAVRLVNSIIAQATSIKASDIHIEPFENDVRVRFRVDGVLSEIMQIPKNTYSSVSTRFKIMASMDIAEKRRPLDGRIETTINGRSYDFRVSSLPTVFGEKIVIRILDRTNFLFERTLLGFSSKENTIIDRFIQIPHGIILVTGPTGSGKSTTLYTLLRELNKPEFNIITVEDPVEYMLNGINQVQVNPKAGLTFATGLRSILRQDPDVIMIGEIRDEETAQIAVRAAITGHIVLSTLHTNDAPSTVSRLLDMGLPGYLVSDALSGIIAQRLVRKLCNECKAPYDATEHEIKILGDISENLTLYKPVGCPKCNNMGYSGRTAIYEVMPVTKNLRIAIEQGKNSEVIRDIALKDGMIDLFNSCKNLVKEGVTTIQEMVRTVYARE